MDGSPAHPVGHLQTALWPVGVHWAFFPQGKPLSQGLTHWCWLHALLSGHSESLSHSPILTRGRKRLVRHLIYSNSYFVWSTDLQRNLLGTHCVYGSPVVPGGQLQTALWLVTEHLADWLQGLLVVQGFTQLLETHAWNVGHSSSDEQPASMGAALGNKAKWDLSFWSVVWKKFWGTVNYGKLTNLLAELVSLASVSLYASTCHGSERQAVIHFALSKLNTGLEGCAWVLAVSSAIGNDAGLFAGTFFVHATAQVLNHWLRN